MAITAIDKLTRVNECRAKFGLKTLIRFLTLIGFCVGVGSIPIYLIVILAIHIFNGAFAPSGDLAVLVLIVPIVWPLICALNFAIYALLAFPIYSCLKPKTYAGIFETLIDSGEPTPGFK
jgi:hypothetical protein